MGKRYVPSNKFNLPLLFVAFICCTLLSAFVAGFSAMLGLWLIPPYAGIVLSLLAAVVIYWIHIYFLKWSKNRSVKAARISIFLTSCISAFVHFSAVSAIMLIMGENIQEVSLTLNQLTLERIVVGTFAYFTAPSVPYMNLVKAGTPWVFYLILGTLFFLIIPQLAAEQAKEPFNEEYNNWMIAVPAVGRLDLIPDRDQPALVNSLLKEDITLLLRYPRYSSQTSRDYSQVVFYKVKNHHTGYVGIENYHQVYDSKKHPIEKRYQTLEFIPPIQIGIKLAETLETAINIQSTSMEKPSFLSIPEPSTTVDLPEEHGYRLYRTTDDSLTFDSDTLERAKYSETLRHYRKSPNRELSESFQYYVEESEKYEREQEQKLKKSKR